MLKLRYEVNARRENVAHQLDLMQNFAKTHGLADIGEKLKIIRK